LSCGGDFNELSATKSFTKERMNRCHATHRITLLARRDNSSESIDLPVQDLVLGGWTGRNQADIEAHVKELEALGIQAPGEFPVFYRVASTLPTTASFMQVTGDSSTGEVEFVLFRHDDAYWVGVGSDHTDRKAELIDITLAKQLCAKPVAGEVWALSDVEPHWDELVLRSWAEAEGERHLYQEARVSTLQAPRSLIGLYEDRNPGGFHSGTVLFSGTFAARDSVGPAMKFSIELEDPVLGRKITHEYDIRTLGRTPDRIPDR
jgi:hypothetical protein